MAPRWRGFVIRASEVLDLNAFTLKLFPSL